MDQPKEHEELESYIVDEFNYELFKEITQGEGRKSFVRPVDIFKLLFELYKLLMAERKNPYIAIFKVRSRIFSYRDLTARFLLFGYFHKYLIYEAGEAFAYEDDFIKCANLVAKEHDELYKETMISSLLGTLPAKPSITTNTTNKTQEAPQNNDEIKCSNSYSFTSSQWVLVTYYAFKHLGIEINNQATTNPSAVTKWLHFITETPFTTAANSSFYNKVRKAPNFKSDNSLVADLEIIKPYFEKVQLSEVVKLIDNEILMARKELSINKQV